MRPNNMIINGFTRSVYFFAVLISLSLTAVLLPKSGFAEALNSATPALRTFNIPAGFLHEALIQFSQQAGIKLAIDPVKLQGKVTFGLTGDFDIKSALDQLLIGSGLQVMKQDDSYTLTEVPASSVDPIVTTLPSIQITASNTNRYAAVSTTTATKTNTLLRDVPQSISVITNELIKDQSIRSIADAVRYVPGVGVSQGEGNRDALVFRGNRSTGDFFTDGIRDDVEYYRDLYNIERVEVLKGANGMIFGRGGSGGVVNRVTKQANWDPVREFSFQGGSFNQKRMTADVGHVINDVAAVRLNAVYEDAGSFRDGVSMERLGISPTVTLKPTHRTKVVASMERFHDDRTADRGITSFMGRPVDVSRAQFFGDPKRSNANIDVLSFNSLIEHKFDSGV
ncbi:MAG: TonB-dependent receptor plug domain-containing protein, partial [Nitrosomonas sp.]|nr:TonB-dependent receptor plug domain-containing protein [Nitrosomonas sp.]